jgi:hypothetical protein
MQGDSMDSEKKIAEEWIEVDLVPSNDMLAALRQRVTDTVTSPPPADLDLLPDVHVEDDGLEGMCSGCGEPIRPGRHGGWEHVGLSDPWHPHAGAPLGPTLEPAEPPVWLETCSFGQSGSRVYACDRDAVEGSEYCVIHTDL